MSDAAGEEELEYYRAVEDFFAGLRGVPHTLSPKDFQLLRGWWREGVPLTAVRAGIAEAVARRRDRGDDTQVVSLSYCRHAVRSHARRLAAAHVGSTGDHAGAAPDCHDAVRSLARLLAEAASASEETWPRPAAVIRRVAEQVDALAGLPAASVEEQLYALETALLAGCHDALAEAQRHTLDGAARAAAGASPSPAAVAAHRDRLLREWLALPRLELP